MRGRTQALTHVLLLAACALVTTSCSSPSYQAAAMEASDAGDQKKAIVLAQKEVERFATPEQCSPGKTINCGTLALAYSSLAEYQILAGDRANGERSFQSAQGALLMTDQANRASATAMVYRDVSEAYWKTGDKARAVVVFKEGRAAGADEWLLMCSAAKVADEKAPVAGAAPNGPPSAPPTAAPPTVPPGAPPGLSPGVPPRS